MFKTILKGIFIYFIFNNTQKNIFINNIKLKLSVVKCVL